MCCRMMTAVSGGLEVALAASIIDMKAEDLAFCVFVLSLGLDDPGRARSFMCPEYQACRELVHLLMPR